MIARFILHHERRHSCERPLVPGLKVRGGGRGCWAAALGGRIGRGRWGERKGRRAAGGGFTKPSAEGVGGGGHGELGRG